VAVLSDPSVINLNQNDSQYQSTFRVIDRTAN
jgi:hypothetical protein